MKIPLRNNIIHLALITTLKQGISFRKKLKLQFLFDYQPTCLRDHSYKAGGQTKHHFMPQLQTQQWYGALTSMCSLYLVLPFNFTQAVLCLLRVTKPYQKFNFLYQHFLKHKIKVFNVLKLLEEVLDTC